MVSTDIDGNDHRRIGQRVRQRIFGHGKWRVRFFNSALSSAYFRGLSTSFRKSHRWPVRYTVRLRLQLKSDKIHGKCPPPQNTIVGVQSGSAHWSTRAIEVRTIDFYFPFAFTLRAQHQITREVHNFLSSFISLDYNLCVHKSIAVTNPARVNHVTIISDVRVDHVHLCWLFKLLSADMPTWNISFGRFGVALIVFNRRTGYVTDRADPFPLQYRKN